MSRRGRGTLLHIVVALAAAIAPVSVRAQGVTSGDTVAKKTPPDKPQRPDSIQAGFGRGTAPLPTLDIGESYSWTRDALFATGALTLGDLLDRLPGYTTFRSGWLAAPQNTAMGGDFTRVRVFIDDIEVDDLNGRDGAAPDLHAMPISALQSLTLARGANELRIDMRTWQYDMTTPYTRVDIQTGDLNTNLYRAFYGKRYYNGTGLQIAGQQYGVTDVRNGGGGDQFGLLARYGVARAGWSLDATAVRTSNTRTTTGRFGGGMLLPGYRSANTIAYLRAAVGHEGKGPFLQLQAATEGLREYSPQYTKSAAQQYGFLPDTADTLASAAQYVATAGFDGGGARLRLVERYRRRLGQGYNSPSATFDFTQKILSLSALAERDEYWGLQRLEAGARLTPLPFISVAGYAGLRDGFGTPAPGHYLEPRSQSARIEGGLRLYPDGPWVIGGAMVRDTAILAPPAVFDSAFTAAFVGRQTATTIALRGPIGYGFSVDGWAAQWQRAYPYTPRYQANGRARFFTQWLRKFPNGNFSFLLEPSVDYRSEVAFPTAAGPRSASAQTVYSVLVELRILRGVITYQRRNLQGILYDQVPGYLMPRPINVYGVRWYFFD